MIESTLDCIHAVWSYKERSLHQFLGTKTTEANKLLKTDAKTVLYRTILRVRAAPPLNYAKEKIKQTMSCKTM